MVELLRDMRYVSLFFTGLSAFSFVSFLGRVVADLSGGVFVLFAIAHVLILLIGLIFAVTAWSQRHAETDPQEAMASAAVIGLSVALVLLLMVWLGSGIGFWVGG